MIKFVYVFMVLGFIGLYIPAYGQDLSSDLQKVRSERDKGNWRKMRVRYTSFETYTATEPEDHDAAMAIEKGPDNYYFDNSLSTSLSINGKTLLIDKEEGRMYLIDQKGVLDQFHQINPDSLLKLCSNIRYLGSESGIHSYELFFSSPLMEFSRIKLSLNMQGLYVTRVVMYYRKSMAKMEGAEVVAWLKPRLEINYTLEQVTTGDQELLDFDHYIHAINGGWSPTPAFENYQIVDQTAKP